MRAIQQGVVYAHQLASPAHAAAPVRSLLSSLLNGHVKELEPLHPPVLECHDGELDRTQREAVARAVAAPDVCLIQGSPGTGKSRLVAEIILQAAQRGERILFLAPTPAALDRVLERLGPHPAVCPIRCLSAEEKPADLPAASARLTLPERLRSYRETTVPAARAARDAARQKVEARKREQTRWPQLEKLAEQHEQLAARVRTLTARRASVADDLNRLEPSAVFGETWQACQRSRTAALECLDGQLAGIQAELETIAGKQTHLDSEWEAIRPLAEARQRHRLWTGAWWRALLQSGLNEQVRDLAARRAELDAARQRLEQDLSARQSEGIEIENRHAAECRRLRDEEIGRRVTVFDCEIAAATREQDALGAQCRNLLAALLGEAVSSEITRQAVASSRAVWERLREQDIQRAAAAEQWLQTIEEGVSAWSEKLASCANVLAATTSTLTATVPFDNARRGDVWIVDESHQVTEPDFAVAARRARRWVLLGRTLTDTEVASNTNALLSTRHTPLATRHFFHRLWQNLHTDPHRLPFAWMRCDGRMLCRLRPLAAEQEKWIETEPVVDRPDIELRILSVPRQAPRIVEVHFPAGMDIGDAKQFIFHELEELAVQTRGRSLCWSETAEEVILELASSINAETLTVALENGVQERVARLPAADAAANGGMDWHTCSLEFSRAAGWTRQVAEEWIAERLGLRSPGRTVLLTAAYRLDAPSRTPSSFPTFQKKSTTENTENTEKRHKTKQRKS
ncbi:MAG: AAA domain-containing protein [Gemmataceae bacterium]